MDLHQALAREVLRIKVGHPKLGMIWNIARGYPVAYRIRIENGSLVIDGMNAMVVGCSVIGSSNNAVTVSLDASK
jgi:hypothetical protein